MMRIAIASLAAVVLGGSITGCVVRARPAAVVVAPAPIVVARPPPPVRVEAVPPAPGDMYVWLPGHWRWDGREYQWDAGHYEARPARAAVWIPDEWVARRGQWVLRPGHWVYR